MRHARCTPLILAALLIGCGGSDEQPDAAPDGAAGADAAPGDAHSIALGPLTVPPGQERTVCMVAPLGNAEPAMVRGITTNLSAGSHHMIVTRATGVASPTPTDCSAFGVSGDTLFIAEKPDAALRYPDGSGLAIGADQLIGLEIHFINYFADEDIEIEGTVTLDLAPPDAQLREVGLIFTGDLGLFLPPLETTTVQSFHTVPPGAEIFAVTSHTHQLGTYAAIHRARGVDDPDAELLHEALLWSEPPLDVFDPPLVLAADEGLALTCEYFNTTEQAVTFGTGFFDEMCFLWAHYVMP